MLTKRILSAYWTRNGSAFSITGTQSGYPLAGKTVNGWKRFEHRISGQTEVTISSNGWIDELWFYPATAKIKTYTHDPFTDVTSETDVNGRIIYYTYDGHGRLVLVKDDDNNVLKRICYNYAGQQENCNLIGNSSQSGSFTKNNCPSGKYGTSVTYTVPSNTYYALSQTEADALAQADIASKGQQYANDSGICVYKNVQKSGQFTKNDCGGGSGSTEKLCGC